MKHTLLPFGAYVAPYWSIRCSLLEHMLLPFGAYVAPFWCIHCSLLEHTLLPFGAYVAPYWSIRCFLLVHTLLPFGAYIAPFWSIRCSLLEHTLLPFGAYVAPFWSIRCFLLEHLLLVLGAFNVFRAVHFNQLRLQQKITLLLLAPQHSSSASNLQYNLTGPESKCLEAVTLKMSKFRLSATGLSKGCPNLKCRHPD